jgi:hypothetical protein
MVLGENVFGNPVIRITCPDENLYKNSDLTKSINRVLNLPEVKFRQKAPRGDSHVGGGMTSVGQTYLQVIHLPGAQDLTQWITDQLLLVKDHLNIDKHATTVSYKRAWANRMFKGSQGKCHRHVELDSYMAEYTDLSSENFRADIVAIFYLDVPENSSNLVFIRDGQPDTLHSIYNEEDKWYLKPVAGELVLHKPDVWHAVTEHGNDLPRNVLVFDVDYV